MKVSEAIKMLESLPNNMEVFLSFATAPTKVKTFDPSPKPSWITHQPKFVPQPATYPTEWWNITCENSQ